MNQVFAYKLQSYYNKRITRILVNSSYILNLIVLTIYLIYIPIQVAYSWLLIGVYNDFNQTIIDCIILFFFIFHIILYLDQKLYKWMKSPYIKWHRKLITIQLIYDIICVFLAILLVIIYAELKKQQLIQLFFLAKVYKLIKYDIKCIYIVIGTWFYPFYKIIRTLFILFLVISYVGSLFYGVAYYLYNTADQFSFLLWIVSAPAINDCVDQPFWIQLQYSMYWALGTASTAAYGDISGAQPTLVLINILALAFEGFLFGFYLNSMHSIPIQRKQKQADILQKFDAFQQHSSNRKIDKKLHLQILCSLQYTQSQKKKMDQIQKFLPKQYLQQIKFNIYKKILDNPIFFSNSDFQLQITQKVGECVSQMGQDVYNYRSINRNDLLYLKEGDIKYYLPGQIETQTMQLVEKGNYIGLYEFITGLLILQRAVCINYCFLYRIAREDYKKLLPDCLKMQFKQLQMKAFLFQCSCLKKQPIVKLNKSIRQSQSKFVLFNVEKKQKLILQRYQKVQNQRRKIKRLQKSHKIYIPKQLTKTRNQQTQTDRIKGLEFEQIYIWNPKNSLDDRIIFTK